MATKVQEPDLRPIQSFSLEPDGAATPQRTPNAWMLYDGRRVGEPVEGVVLEAQFARDDSPIGGPIGGRIGRQFVLLVTHDCPFEERLSIYLLDAAFSVIDRVDIGHPYA
ncbi:MAG: hypothetical protein ACR2RL_13555, partial [Gammaproteobacteria bacterium]